MSPQPRACLLILDGFGIGPDSLCNAIQNAKMPFYRKLWKDFPHSQLLTHGRAVGLPEGVMGNSEVGHMTMGSGRVLYQDLVRIHQSITDKSFFQHPVLRPAIENSARATTRLHLMGLLSDGGVHSHIGHLEALLDLAHQVGHPDVVVHGFLDGRDTPPESGRDYVARLLKRPDVRIASLSGRFYAMDRDQHWERIEQAFEAISGRRVAADGIELTPLAAIDASYRAGVTDEFFQPLSLKPEHGFRPGDAVIFFNFRSDRARELTTRMIRPENRPSPFVGMTQYDRKLQCQVAFPPQSLKNGLGEWISNRSLRQFRLAETEKYAHVTFFFNGGREAPFPGEERLLVPSPRDVETYDQKPEMSAFEVAAQAKHRIETCDDAFVLMNFANADMVGHTGNYEATVRAMEVLDQCLATVIGAAERNGMHVLLTADHGNAEQMCDAEGRPHTQHTLNPVPAIWIEPGSAISPIALKRPLRDGSLADVMPTLLDLMRLPLPDGLDGTTLRSKS